MDGNVLFSRVIDTVQETNLKIGDSFGSISLYYPYDGNYVELVEVFRKASADFPDMILEQLPQRVRVIVTEKDCARISKMPVRVTIKDMVALIKAHLSFEEFRERILSLYPDAEIYDSEYPEFDWLLIFPEDLDRDVYCLTEEMGQITYHRYSEDEFSDFGFTIPDRT